MSLRKIRTTLTIVALTVPGLAVARIYPGAAYYFGALNGDEWLPFRFYSLFTYALYPGPVLGWALGAISLLCAGLVIEPVLGGRQVWALAVGSGSLAALTFVLIPGNSGLLVGNAIVAWGFGGATCVIGVRRWPHLGWVLKSYIVLAWLLILPFVLIVFAPKLDAGAMTQCVAIASGVFFAAFHELRASRARPNNRLKQTARGRSGAESLRRTRAAA